MYWDALTETGVIASIVLAAIAFYLVLRERPAVNHREVLETPPGRTVNEDWLSAY